MNAKSCTALVLTAVLATTSVAQTNVTVYGSLDVGVDVSNQGRGTLKRVISGGTRAGSAVGFRGSEDLGDGLKAVFKIEQGLSLDTGTLNDGGKAFSRGSAVGFDSARWGQLVVGRIPSPYYHVLYAVDAFGWEGNGGLTSLTRGPQSLPLQPLAIVARSDNSIRYDTPAWVPIQLRALISAGEGDPTLGRAHSVSARYIAHSVDAVAGWMRQGGAFNVGTNGRITAWVIGGSYVIGPISVFAGYNRESNGCITCAGISSRGPGVTKADFALLNLGARASVGLTSFVAQVARIKDRSAYTVTAGNRDATEAAIGIDHDLSKRTRLWASLGSLRNANGAQYAIGSGTALLPAGSVGSNNPSATAASAGVRLLF